ncbi:hypothetical protein B0H98_101275 [Vreelandella songnenensis]|uniref:Uncharacterized protein n=1 Tax=Vreelandella songnenensis TaxID=1176243 RepID=A0A2T0V855_9GAMM|nr:hypothetical protein [Halomonas songnenensis]PRY66297.1 hypothetical protein B0H98_101275 [Halomonas songnenensis]
MKNQASWANSGVLSLSVAVSKIAATGGSLQGTENNRLYGCCRVAAFFECQREELYRGEIHACQERGVSAHKLKNLTTREPSFYGNSGNKATASNHAGSSVALVIREVATMATHIFIYLCSCVSVAISKNRGNSVATKKSIKISEIDPVALLPRFLRPRGWKHTGERIPFVLRTTSSDLVTPTPFPSWQAFFTQLNISRWWGFGSTVSPAHPCQQ